MQPIPVDQWPQHCYVCNTLLGSRPDLMKNAGTLLSFPDVENRVGMEIPKIMRPVCWGCIEEGEA
jgi:hypothetical protein